MNDPSVAGGEALDPPPGGIHRLKLLYQRNERKVAIASFSGGFILDALTVDRVDSWRLIGQQVGYLAVIMVALTQMFLEEGRPLRELDKMSVLKRWYFNYRTALVSFLLGTLLNLYTIFYFKSSSLVVSFAFLGFLVVLLVANESARFKSLGLSFRFALLSLCMLSFFACMVPVLVGSIGLVVFLFSILVGCVPLIGLSLWIRARAPERLQQARRQISIPLGLVLVGFLAFYLFRLIPPVPLSIPFIGVYHDVEKTAEGYRLSHERPAWRFWENGDQQFLAQGGDKIYVFFRIFSPTRFSDQVTMRWYWKDDAGRWARQDSIPINIVGGRKEGFRGYGVKANYQFGDWKVQVETNDGREIGRIYFNVEIAPVAQRSFEVDLD
ncbi:MAG: DUF2914 domain-containing protein [Burkholderiales bacterium]